MSCFKPNKSIHINIYTAKDPYKCDVHYSLKYSKQFWFCWIQKIEKRKRNSLLNVKKNVYHLWFSKSSSNKTKTFYTINDKNVILFNFIHVCFFHIVFNYCFDNRKRKKCNCVCRTLWNIRCIQMNLSGHVVRLVLRSTITRQLFPLWLLENSVVSIVKNKNILLTRGFIANVACDFQSLNI